MYNTLREKLQIPEYGRHIQKMIEYVKTIPDRDTRNEQIRVVIQIMGFLHPAQKDLNDYQQKLWDYAYEIADFDLDVDSPFPVPTRESVSEKPNQVPMQWTPVKAPHYGRNIQNMIEVVAKKEDGEMKDEMIKALASYMRQQYLIWNKNSVSEETIFKDIRKLSNDTLIVPDYIHLSAINEKESFNRPGIMANNNTYMAQRPKQKNNKNKNKRWKK
ncbi:MAG: DUF4290 domain-containing protein [Bacteroidales bacterium]